MCAGASHSVRLKVPAGEGVGHGGGGGSRKDGQQGATAPQDPRPSPSHTTAFPHQAL